MSARSAIANAASSMVLRVLIVEGNRADAESLQRTLTDQSGGPAFEVTNVATLKEMLKALAAQPFDAILLDLRLPDASGLAAVATVLTMTPGAAVVVLTEPEDEVLALKAMQVGAQDYLVKGQVFGTMLARTIRHAIEHQRSDEIARRSSDRVRFQATLLEAVGEAVIAIDLSHALTFWNRHAEILFGWSADEAAGRDLLEIITTDATRAELEGVMHSVANGEAWSGELQLRCRDDRVFSAFATATPIRNETGSVIGIVVAIADLTELKELERDLRHAQRMEAMGRLAGGVAHDFNNILTSIQGYSEFVLADVPKTDPVYADVQEILRAAERAAALTRQLLAFSRKQHLSPRIVDMADIVRGMATMLRRLIGEDIELELHIDDDLGCTCADPGQLEQVILNLVVNARDAMPGGGRITMELSNTAVPSPMVVLRVRDEGSGIPDDVLPHLYEPFFTTKPQGEETGLGLSTVYGIVSQTGGYVEAANTVEGGAVFSVYLPRVEHEAEKQVGRSEETPLGRGETILVVEDDPAVREVAVRMLRSLGYKVLVATNSHEAIQICKRRDQPIHLLLTDVVMPDLSGPELAAHVRRIRDDVIVRYMSGYTSDRIASHIGPGELNTLIEKPFTRSALATHLRLALDQPK